MKTWFFQDNAKRVKNSSKLIQDSVRRIQSHVGSRSIARISLLGEALVS